MTFLCNITKKLECAIPTATKVTELEKDKKTYHCHKKYKTADRAWLSFQEEPESKRKFMKAM